MSGPGQGDARSFGLRVPGEQREETFGADPGAGDQFSQPCPRLFVGDVPAVELVGVTGRPVTVGSSPASLAYKVMPGAAVAAVEAGPSVHGSRWSASHLSQIDRTGRSRPPQTRL